MIIKEIINDNTIKHYSDQFFTIRQIETGVIYDEAYDILPCQFTYEETDEERILSEEDYKQLSEYYKTLLDTVSGE